MKFHIEEKPGVPGEVCEMNSIKNFSQLVLIMILGSSLVLIQKSLSKPAEATPREKQVAFEVQSAREDLAKVLVSFEDLSKDQKALETLRTLTLAAIQTVPIRDAGRASCFDFAGKAVNFSSFGGSDERGVALCVSSSRLAQELDHRGLRLQIMGLLVYQYALLVGGNPSLASDLQERIMMRQPQSEVQLSLLNKKNQVVEQNGKEIL